jgi:hypothetical protein
MVGDFHRQRAEHASHPEICDVFTTVPKFMFAHANVHELRQAARRKSVLAIIKFIYLRPRQPRLTTKRPVTPQEMMKDT